MEESNTDETLEESFRQSRREFWFLIGTWIVFALWTMLVNTRLAGNEGKESVETLLGMPKWVVLGVALPWVSALGVTIWFAFRFMKDTPLEGIEEDATPE